MARLEENLYFLVSHVTLDSFTYVCFTVYIQVTQIFVSNFESKSLQIPNQNSSFFWLFDVIPRLVAKQVASKVSEFDSGRDQVEIIEPLGS